jgi:nicotine blue oxidoreductase
MTAAAIQAISESPSEIAMGTFGGKSGHPVKFARKHWAEIISSAVGDIGARNFLKGRSDISHIELSAIAGGDDVDTPADLDSFKS